MGNRDSNDSTGMAVQELASIEREQLRILSDMNSKQSANMNTSNNIMAHPQTPNYMPPNTNGGYGGQYQPNYFPPMFPMSADAVARQQQFTQHMKALNPATGYGFFNSVLPKNVRTFGQNSTLSSMDFSSKVSQAAVAGIGAGTATLGSIAAGSMFPGLGAGLLAPIGIGAAAGLWADISIDEIQKQNAYEKYFMQNSYRFINSQESVNKRGLSGFSLQQARDAGKFLRDNSENFYLKDEEMMNLTQRFTEGGLLKDTKDLESFKKRMQVLTKSVKSSALILNETYDEVAKLMSDLKKLGFDQKDFSNVMTDIKINASSLGVDAGDLAQKIVDALKQLNAGTPYDNTVTNSRINDTTIYLGSLYNELEAKQGKTSKEREIYNTIKNFGGPDDASIRAVALMESMLMKTQVSQPAAALYNYDAESKEWKIDNDVFTKFTSGQLNYQQMMDISGQKFRALNESGHGSALVDWESNAGTYLRNSLSDGDMTKVLTSVVTSMLQHPDYASHNFDISSLLSGQFGITEPGQKNLLASLFEYRQLKGDMFSNNQRLQNMWVKQTGDVMSEIPTLKEWAESKWGKFKSWASEGVVDMSSDISDFMLNFKEKFFGVNKKIPTRYDKTFTIRELTDGFDSQSIRKKQDEAYRLLADANEGLETIYSNPGINADTKLLNMSRKALEYTQGDMSYSREIITNWEQISAEMKELKDVFIGSAQNNKISESILVALSKYDQTTSGKKITKEDIENLAGNLGKYIKEYGGNEQLALAKQLGINVDQILLNNNINAGKLREQGRERMLLDINFSELEMDEKIRQKFEAAFNQNIRNEGYNKSTETVKTTKEVTTSGKFTSDALDYSHYSGAGHMKDLIKKAAEEYGIGEEYIAALTKTENDNGNNNYVNSINATGVMQLTPVAVEKYKNKGIKSLSTGQVWNNSMDQLRTDIGMNVAVGANEYKDMIDIAKGNAYLAYGFYSHGPTGFKKVLNRAGITEDQYAGLTPDQILEMSRNYGRGDTFATMERYYKQLKLFTKGFTTWTGKGETKTVTEEVEVPVEGAIEQTQRNPKNRNGVDTHLSYVDEEGKPVDPNDPNLHIKRGMKTSKERADFVNSNTRFVTTSKKLMGLNRDVYDAGVTDYISNAAGARGKYGFSENVSDAEIRAAMQGSFMPGRTNTPAGSAANKYTDYIREQMDETGLSVDEILSKDSKAGRLRNRLIRKLKKDGVENFSADELDQLLNGREIIGAFSPKQMILETLGTANGITKRSVEYGGDLNKYNADLIANAELTYKGNIEQMLEYVKGSLSGNMSEAGQAWQNRSTTEKASIIETTKILSEVLKGGQKSGYEGVEQEINKVLKENGKGTTNDAINVLLNEKEQEQTKYLHKEKDSNGKETGAIYYDANKESEDEISSSDVVEWVRQGEKSKNVILAEREFKEVNNVDLGQLSYKEGIKESKKLYQKMLTSSFEAQNKLTEIDLTNFSNEAVGQEAMGYIEGNNVEGMKKLLDSLNAKILNGETEFQGDYDKVQDVLKLMEQLNSELNPESILKMIEGIEKFQNIAKDVGNITTLTMGINNEVLNTDFTMRVMDQVKEILGKDKETSPIAEALEKGQVEIKDLLNALVNGGALEIDGKTIELSADTMNSLAVLFGKEMEGAIKDNLKNDTEVGDQQGFIDSILNNKPIREAMEQLTGGKEALELGFKNLAKSNKDIEELKKGNQEAAKALKEGNETLEQTIARVEEERDVIVNGLYSSYQQALTELSRNLKDSEENVKNFDTTMGKYDAAIAKAIKIMEDRIVKLEGENQTMAERLINFFINPFRGNNSGGNTYPNND